MSVGIAGFGHKHYRRFVPPARRHFAHILAADHLGEILLPREQSLDILVHTSAAVPADIHHDALAVVVLPEKGRVHRAERVVAHRFYVNISKAAVG